jgi:predicted RNase H-like HicB family nuclease
VVEQKKNKPPATPGNSGGGRHESEKLNLFLFLRGVLGLRGLRLGGALLEFVHAAGGVHELLLAGVKRMADVADADDDGRAGGTRLDHVAAGATDFRVHIFRMNVRLHKKDVKTINLSSGEGFSAKIPGFAGLIVFSPTRSEVMTELKSALEGWIELSLERGDEFCPRFNHN